MKKTVGTYALIHQNDDGSFCVKVHASTGRVRSIPVRDAGSPEAARAAWAATHQSLRVPLLYGRHVVETDEKGRSLKAIIWARMNGVVYRLTEKVWYAKEGDAFTLQVSARRGVNGGYVWASRRAVDPRDKRAVMAQAIRDNHAAGSQPTVFSNKDDDTRKSFFTSADREATSVEQWVA